MRIEFKPGPAPIRRDGLDYIQDLLPRVNIVSGRVSTGEVFFTRNGIFTVRGDDYSPPLVKLWSDVLVGLDPAKIKLRKPDENVILLVDAQSGSAVGGIIPDQIRLVHDNGTSVKIVHESGFLLDTTFLYKIGNGRYSAAAMDRLLAAAMSGEKPENFYGLPFVKVNEPTLIGEKLQVVATKVTGVVDYINDFVVINNGQLVPRAVLWPLARGVWKNH